MDEFINLSIDDKKFVIEETALKYKLTPQIIEKDFWISYILKFLFNESKYKNYLTFKGGTSLSKVYDVIFRMSEDIDLILDWTILGIENNTPFMERSIRQQNKYNDYILPLHNVLYSYKMQGENFLHLLQVTLNCNFDI